MTSPAPSKGGLLLVFVYLKNSIKHPLEGLGCKISGKAEETLLGCIDV